MAQALQRSEALAVASEVRSLKRVLVHRPGAELARLTEGNAGSLLFDELPHPDLAAQQHDNFTEILRSAGVDVIYALDVLATAFADDLTRRSTIDAVARRSGLGHVGRLFEYLHELSPTDLAQRLVSGFTADELCAEASASTPPTSGLAPLPNFMFMRDSSSVIGDSIHIAHMRNAARRREALLARVIQAEFRASNQPLYASSVEGGDILVASASTLVLGAGERSSFESAMELSAQFLHRVPDGTVIIVPLPEERWAMHLDTVLTMVADERYLAYAELYDQLSGYRFGLTRRGVECFGADDISTALTKANGGRTPDILRFTGSSTDLRLEQWNDAYNVLAVAPNIVINYAHNERCNAQLAAFGVDVRPIPGLELGKGRGGPHCMSCPLIRAA